MPRSQNSYFKKSERTGIKRGDSPIRDASDSPKTAEQKRLDRINRANAEGRVIAGPADAAEIAARIAEGQFTPRRSKER